MLRPLPRRFRWRVCLGALGRFGTVVLGGTVAPGGTVSVFAQSPPSWVAPFGTLGVLGGHQGNALGLTQWGASPGLTALAWRHTGSLGWEVGINRLNQVNVAGWAQVSLREKSRAFGGLRWHENRLLPLVGTTWKSDRTAVRTQAEWTVSGPYLNVLCEYRPPGPWAAFLRTEHFPALRMPSWTLGVQWASRQQTVEAGFSAGGKVVLAWRSSHPSGAGPWVECSLGSLGPLGASVGWTWPLKPGTSASIPWPWPRNGPTKMPP